MDNEQKIARIRELTEILNHASLVYYQEGREIMPNIDYDRYYDELLELEKETGFRLANSPSQNVGYEIISELPKERHESPMLSLDKTKSPEELKVWLNGKQGVLSWKLDGITCVVTYENGSLVKAVTRGNGEIGELITANARNFENLPGSIPFLGKLIIRGEAVISYSDFDRINDEIEDTAARYKNPRNLCSGSVRQLDPSVTAGRHVRLIIFTLVSAEGTAEHPEVPDFHNSFAAQYDWLSSLGFEVVDHRFTDASTLDSDIEAYKVRIPTYDIPSDGLVLAYEDVAYGISLGRTAKFPRHSIAFKWQDETAETTLRYIDWSASRTGLINPVAVFDPVELEGTTVSRASVHNVSIVEELQLGEGDTVSVYKANMIIPQISDNLTRSGKVKIPAACPVCGGRTELRRGADKRSDTGNEYEGSGVLVHDGGPALLYCINPDCPAKQIKSFELMASRDALNIDGLSGKTLEKLLGEGFIHEYADLFKLDRYREQIAQLDGFGEKSADNIIAAASRASETDLYRLIYGLGIPGVGLSGAKLITKAFGYSLDAVMAADSESLKEIDGIGPVLADNFTAFFENEENHRRTLSLAAVLHFNDDFSANADIEKIFAGKTFVITGDLAHFANRREAQDVIEKLGGRAAGSVSAKTSYLINNDVASTSSKNEKAKQLGVPIISEEEFIAMLPKEVM